MAEDRNPAFPKDWHGIKPGIGGGILAAWLMAILLAWVIIGVFGA